MTRTSTVSVFPDRRENHALLQRAQHLGLGRKAHVADLVEKQRAPVGSSNFPAAVRKGAGENSLSYAEEARSRSTPTDGGAVDLERTARAARGLSAWIARATSSLPVPFCPVISTRAGVGATFSRRSITLADRLARADDLVLGMHSCLRRTFSLTSHDMLQRRCAT